MRHRLTYANVMATVAVFIALGGVSWAAVTLPANSVGTRQLVDRAVTGDKIARGGIGMISMSADAISALRGTKGDVGPAGPKGEAGGPGPQGVQGPGGSQGSRGETGPKGDVGSKGDTGTQGPQGLQGPQGVRGDAGPQGPQGIEGAQGPQGVRGLTGPEGPQGGQGPRGIQGEVGPRGPQGETGPQGLQGVQGPQGVRGDVGPQGLQGVRGEVGPIGPQGLTGLAGTQGIQGATGPAGPQGPRGDSGPVGPQGPKGETGASGPSGKDAAGLYVVTKSATEITMRGSDGTVSSGPIGTFDVPPDTPVMNLYAGYKVEGNCGTGTSYYNGWYTNTYQPMLTARLRLTSPTGSESTYEASITSYPSVYPDGFVSRFSSPDSGNNRPNLSSAPSGRILLPAAGQWTAAMEFYPQYNGCPANVVFAKMRDFTVWISQTSLTAQ